MAANTQRSSIATPGRARTFSAKSGTTFRIDNLGAVSTQGIFAPDDGRRLDLWSGTTGAGVESNGIIEFDLSDVLANVLAATMDMTTDSANSVVNPVDIFRVLRAVVHSPTLNNINWINFDIAGGPLAWAALGMLAGTDYDDSVKATFTPPITTGVQFVVTDANLKTIVQQGKDAGNTLFLALITSVPAGNDRRNYRSWQETNPPTLNITSNPGGRLRFSKIRGQYNDVSFLRTSQIRSSR